MELKRITKHVGCKKVVDRVIGRLDHRDMIAELVWCKLPIASRRLDDFMEAVDDYLDAEYALEHTVVRMPREIDRGRELCDDDEDGRWRNRDLPDHLAFVEQGGREAVNEHLDLRIDDAATGIREIVPSNPDYYRFHWFSGAYDADESRVVPRIRRRMDAGHFRELCYQSGGKNQALYERRKIDFDAAQHLRPEWLQSKLEIDWDDAVSLAEFLRRMRFNRQMTLKLVFGFMARPEGFDHRPKGGLQVLNKTQMADWVARLEAVAEDLPELPEDVSQVEHDYDETNRFYFDESNWVDFEDPLEHMDWIEENTRESLEFSGQPAHHGDIERLVELGFNPKTALDDAKERLDEYRQLLPTDDPDRVRAAIAYYRLLRDEKAAEKDKITCEHLMQAAKYLPFNSNPYSSFPLHCGEEAIGWDLVLEIKNAKLEKDNPFDKNEPDSLKEIQNRMFDQKGYRSWSPAEYRHFTYGQRASFWAYVNARKQEILQAHRRALSQHTIDLIAEVRSMGPGKVTKALIMAYKNGGSFESDTHYYEFSDIPRPSAEDMYILWGIYRELESGDGDQA